MACWRWTRWWFPPDRPDSQGATVLGLLASLSLIVGYHGTLLGQSMTFAADEFGSSTTAQGAALSWARVGGFLALLLGAAADRRGRRKLLLLSLLLCIGSTVAGAFSPNLAVLASTQAVNRGAWAAAVLLLAVVIAEEMPKGARAYAAGINVSGRQKGKDDGGQGALHLAAGAAGGGELRDGQVPQPAGRVVGELRRRRLLARHRHRVEPARRQSGRVLAAVRSHHHHGARSLRRGPLRRVARKTIAPRRRLP